MPLLACRFMAPIEKTAIGIPCLVQRRLTSFLAGELVIVAPWIQLAR